jgi:hypothetical protein
MDNNDSIELQLNSKRVRIEVDLANVSTGPYLRKKKIMITILVTETTFEEHIYKKYLVNHLTIIFHKYNLKNYGIILIAWFKNNS